MQTSLKSFSFIYWLLSHKLQVILGWENTSTYLRMISTKILFKRTELDVLLKHKENQSVNWSILQLHKDIQNI